MQDETDAVTSAFADAILEQDWDAAHACCAPWLLDDLEPEAIAAAVEAARDERPWPATYRISGNSFTTPETLRAKWAQRSGPAGKGGTSGTAAPARPIPDEVTMENHRRFVLLHFEPSDEDNAEHDVELSFVIRALLVSHGTGVCVGWFEATN